MQTYIVSCINREGYGVAIKDKLCQRQNDAAIDTAHMQDNVDM